MFKFSLTPDTSASRERSEIERLILNTQIRLGDSVYVPAIRWRMAEYQSLYHLPVAIKEHVVPFITIPSIEYDFEEDRPVKTALDHINLFIKRYTKYWHKRVCWLTIDDEITSAKIDGSENIFDYVFHSLRSGELAVPALRVNANNEITDAIARINSVDRFGIAIVINLEDLMATDINSQIDTLIYNIKCSRNDCDLILDMGSPNYKPYDRFSSVLSHHVGRIRDLSKFRNFILIGTAIPSSYSRIARGSDRVERHDWSFYKYYVQKLKKMDRKPNYGDHTIVHPSFTAVDMRGRIFLGKIVYATDDHWAIRKGGSFRKDPSQMRNHCNEIMTDPQFQYRGANFSRGDQIISNCARGRTGSGNLTTWKHVGIIHHMTVVVGDLPLI